ncbi:MAG: DnaJ domain-containing protein [Candidatus Aquicultorales bacterium]
MRYNDYYAVLEVDKRASVEVIDKAHKALSLKHHPDKQAAAERAAATEKMKLINEAYSVLADADKRTAYDAYLRRKKWEIFYTEGIVGLVREYILD